MKSLKSKLYRVRKVGITLLAVALVALAGYFYWGRGASAAEYMTARVERGNLRNSVTATGTLQAVTTVQVGSQASGTISALYADFNSTVTKGQIIAQLDPSTSQVQVEQARANLTQARAGLEQARAGVASAAAGVSQSRAGITDAQAKEVAAQSAVQNQEAGVSVAQANLAMLKAQLDDAESLLRQEESLAASGVVSQRQVETARTSYKTAEARYRQGVAQVEQARLNAQLSSNSGMVQSQAAVEQAKAQSQQARAQAQNSAAQVQNALAGVQQAQAALRLAEINLSHTTIRSPIGGVVVSRDVDVGQTVAASLSAPTLFTIAQDLKEMQVIANIDQADIGLVEQAKRVTFTVDAFTGQEFTGTIQQIRLNPQATQNVVTYNVVINVSNPEQKLKPGMTANLTITIDERSDVVKVPNAALRFSPQFSAGERGRNRESDESNSNGRRASRRNESAEDGSDVPGRTENVGQRERQRVVSPTSPVVAGQLRRVWVMGQDGKPQPRRITVGLTDGAATEVAGGELQVGETVITGQNISGAASQSGNSETAPGFGGAPRVGGAGGGGGRRR